MVGMTTEHFVLADLDNQGALDVGAVTTYTNVAVAPYQAAGSFGPSEFYSVGHNPSGIAAGDFDADGDDDLVTLAYEMITVLINRCR